jgi:hypothetical protein
LLYVAVTAATGIAILIQAALNIHGVGIIPLEFFCIAAAAAEIPRVTGPGRSVTLSLSVAVILASLVALGPSATILVAAAGALGNGFFPRFKPVHKILFNLGLYTLSAGAAGVAYSALTAGQGQHVLSLVVVPAVALATVAYFGVNWPLLVGVIRVSTGRPVLEVWAADIRWTPGPILLAAALGAALGANYLALGWWGLVLLIAPLVAVQFTLLAQARAARMFVIKTAAR